MEAAEAEQKRKEEEEAHERAAREAAEKEAARARMREQKALSLGDEPEKGPSVTQVISFFLLSLWFRHFYYLSSNDHFPSSLRFPLFSVGMPNTSLLPN